jgi:hypothetical protein
MEDANRDIEEQIRNLCDRTSDRMDRRILADLFGRLRQDKTSRPAVRSPGLWRIIMRSTRTKLAAAAVLAVGVMLPVSYGTVQVIRKYFAVSVQSVAVEYPGANGVTAQSIVQTLVVESDQTQSEEQTRARLEEFRRLYLAGEAVEVQPGVWRATLSDGTEFSYDGPDPGQAGQEPRSMPEEKER